MPVKQRQQNNNLTPNAFFTPANFTPATGAGRAPTNTRTSGGASQPRTGGGEERPRSFPLTSLQNEGETRKAFIRRIREGGGGEAFQEAPQLTAQQVTETQENREEAIESLGQEVAPTIQPFDENINPIGNIFEGAAGVTGVAGAAGAAGATAAKLGLGTASAGGLIAGAAAIALGGLIYANIKSNQKQITTDAYEGFTNSRNGVVAVDNQILNAAEAGADPASIAQRYNENLANALEVERVLTSLVDEQVAGLNYRKASDELRDVRAYLAVENIRRQEIIDAINNPTGRIVPPPIIEQQVEEVGGLFS